MTAVQASFLGSFIAMSDPNADAYILKDVSEAVEGGAWRWTHRRPELRFFLAGSDRRIFMMEFNLPRATFDVTGPVTLSIFVNGKAAGHERFDTSGDQRLKLAVPPDLIKPGALNTVAIESDKYWVSKGDDVVLGFILKAAGFEE